MDAPAVSDLNPVSCDWCPRNCGANRFAGERGYCGAGAELMVARAALHHWEEPPISGVSGSGTIFYSHCPLRCSYCQNAIIAYGAAGKAVDIERLARIMLELQDQHALNINMVTPTHYAEHICAAVDCARGLGLHVPIVWNTSGYELPARIERLAGTVDVFLDDFKYLSREAGKAYSHAPNYSEFAFASLDRMVDVVGSPEFDSYDGQERLRRGVIVRHLMLPNRLEESMELVARLHARYGADIRLSLMNQYTPVLDDIAKRCKALGGKRIPEALVEHARRELKLHPELAERVSGEEYEELLDFADTLGVKDFYWQQGGASEGSFIPPFELQGV